MSMNHSLEGSFSADPYLEPDNIHELVDGRVVAFGPHGQEFELDEAQLAATAAINIGLDPSYAQRVVDWHTAHNEDSISHPL
jgi:hypothetical protein